MHLHVIETGRKIADIVSGKLDLSHYRISYSRNGKEAWEFIRANKPDLVVVDFKAPDRLHPILERHHATDDSCRSIRLIVVGSNLSEKRIADLKEIGVDEFVDQADFTPEYVREYAVKHGLAEAA